MASTPILSDVQSLRDAQSRGEINPFFDYQPVTLTEIIKCVILLPLCVARLFLCMLLIPLSALLASIVVCGVDTSKPYGPCRAKIVAWLQFAFCRVLMFLMGVYWLERSGPPMQAQADGRRVVVAVAPHVSLLDAMAVCCAGAPVSPVVISWVPTIPFLGSLCNMSQAILVHRRQNTKAPLAKAHPAVSTILVPLAKLEEGASVQPDDAGVGVGLQGGGPLPADMMQPSPLPQMGVGVGFTEESDSPTPLNSPGLGDRGGLNRGGLKGNPHGPMGTVEQIVARLEVQQEGWFPPMIFPEGTTHNGRGLLQFKTGAFVAQAPVQPVVLTYPHYLFSPAWTTSSMLFLFGRMLCQVYTRVQVQVLEPVLPLENETPKAFAHRVMHRIAAQSGLPCLPVDYSLCRPYLADHVKDSPSFQVCPCTSETKTPRMASGSEYASDGHADLHDELAKLEPQVAAPLQAGIQTGR